MRLVADPVFNMRRRKHNLIRSEVALFPANLETSCAFDYEIDFVCGGVSVPLLLLPGLETIDVGEHAFGLEQIHLLHLLWREAALRF